MTCPVEAIPASIRAALHKGFLTAARWFAPEPETPWKLIREVLEQGRADGLSDVQLAGGVYTVLAARGLLSEGRA